MSIFKHTQYIPLAIALMVMISCTIQAADSNSFELIINNRCDDAIKMRIFSKETSESVVAEQVVAPGASTHVVIDPAIAGDSIQVTNLRTEGEIRIYMNNLLQDRQNSSAVAIAIENANFSADRPKAVDIKW